VIALSPDISVDFHFFSSSEDPETTAEITSKEEVNTDDLPTPGYPTQWTLSSDQPYLRN